MPLAAAGDTWGIAGSTFLVGYLVIAAVTWIVAVRVRRALADLGPARSVGLADQPLDVAYLNNGADLAVCSALGSLRLRGLITATRGTITAVGRPDTRAPELEQAIHIAANTPMPRARLAFQRPVRAALATIDARLVAAGLLLAAQRRRRIRLVGLWMLAVLALGFVRMLAGTAAGKPVGFLGVEMVGVALIGFSLLCSAPRRSKQGDEALAGMRISLDRFSPGQRPDWTVYGPAAAALGIGLYGTSALWASDPAMAQELAVQRLGTGGSSDGGSSGGGGSSCGGGGSSCGGGGGCGGGGCGG